MNNSNKNTHHHHNNQYGTEFSLFVGDLPDDCSDEKLQRLFQSKFKSVKRVQIIKHEDGKSRGFGFIRFEDEEEFLAARSQDMRIGNRSLRLDTAHRTNSKIRNRYSSINSTGSNSSHQPNHHVFNNNTNSSNNNSGSNNSSSSSLHHPHHHHHHNQSHHHHHNQSRPLHGQQHLPNPQQQSQNNKTLIPDQGIGGQQSHHQGGPHGSNGRLNNALHHGGINPMGPSTIHHHSPHPHQQSQQQLHNPSHNAQINPNLFNSSQQKNSQQAAGSRSPKREQPGLGSGGDDVSSHNKQSAAQQTRPNLITHQQSPPQPMPQQNLTQVGNSSSAHVASNNTTTTATSTSAVASLSSSTEVTSHPPSALLPNQLTPNAIGQAPLGPDYRGYAQSGMMENPHLIGATDPASMVSQSSVYGHMYPYGPPPHFGYMPPQPNPVIPISAVPPQPPSQVSSTTGVAQQHSIPSGNAARYGSAPHHGQHHMPDAMNHMSAGVQAPPQAPFYYYYPSPFYFDQTGAAPPNMYHPQTIHPQFFALPNPAYMPNAHTYANQHQTQPPLPPASQSDANIPIVSQQPPPLQQQSHPQQVNIRTRDIDAPIE